MLTVRLFGDDLSVYQDDRELALEPGSRLILAFMLLHRDRQFTRQALLDVGAAARDSVSQASPT